MEPSSEVNWDKIRRKKDDSTNASMKTSPRVSYDADDSISRSHQSDKDTGDQIEPHSHTARHSKVLFDHSDLTELSEQDPHFVVKVEEPQSRSFCHIRSNWEKITTEENQPSVIGSKGTKKQTPPEDEREKSKRYSLSEDQNIELSQDPQYVVKVDEPHSRSFRHIMANWEKITTEATPSSVMGSKGTKKRTPTHYPEDESLRSQKCSPSEDQNIGTSSKTGHIEHQTTNLLDRGRRIPEIGPSGEVNFNQTGLKKQDFSSTTSPAGSYDLVASNEKREHSGRATRFQIKPFRRMVRQLETSLDHSTVMELAQLTDQGPDFVLEVDKHKKPFHYLMANWEKTGIVTESDVGTLLELLQEVEAYEALYLVKEYISPTSDSSVERSEKSSATPRGVQHSMGSFSSAPPIAESGIRVAQPKARYTSTNPSMTMHPVSQLMQEKRDIMRILQSFGLARLDGKNLGIIDTMRLESIHFVDETLSSSNVVSAFLTRLMSYDYRAIRLFKELEKPQDACSIDESQLQNTSLTDSNNTTKLSCRDFVYAVLKNCDPFLQQEVLSKMSACHLAVPIILPGYKESSPTFLLWGLQNIQKAWQDPRSREVKEVYVSQFPYPVVSAVRFGEPGCSKSNILNKMLGSVQGNDQHPYFCSQEQDVTPSILSKGSLEALWYLPSHAKKNSYSINQAICFLNLRGDALELTSQMQFVCEYTMYMIVFVNIKEAAQIMSRIDEITQKAKVLVVVSSNREIRGQNGNNVESLRATGATILDTSMLSQIDICENICKHIEHFFSNRKSSSLNLESMSSTCEKIGVAVDMLNTECSRAKTIAEKILQTSSEKLVEYKLKAFPLQPDWQIWCRIDKDRNWKSAQGNIERELARLHEVKGNLRKRQRDIGMSNEMVLLYEELRSSSAEYKQFLVFWLQHFLYKASSFAGSRPLLNDMNRDELRKVRARKSALERQSNVSSISVTERRKIKDSIKQMKSKEDELLKLQEANSEKFDSSLGFEHFVREFGQMYECFKGTDYDRKRNTNIYVTVNSLPRLAAEMLLGGHPLEIFDGDTSHVPVKWLKGVLTAVQEITGDASVYVISVIGIQSSGKSTLLNSIFGARFAVSAGRCTRGVFMQLLPISDNLGKDLDCNFIVVIDTEGLKSPEKAVFERKSDDNELATYALCLSDMTLINIGGQTVGEELSNILQISAHAFIRMKEVRLRSSCYLIQQFVADITAINRNENSTQSVLQKLDQAVIAAAAEEGREDQYRQFSDCFNIVNIDNKDGNVQYIPSLWRGSMSSPNHQYSENVIKLKSALLGEIRNNAVHTISDFEKRIISVWEAVKQEDFVFNFRNIKEILQYNNFTQFLKKQQLKLAHEMMKWELKAKQQIRNTTAESIEKRKGSLLEELERKLEEEMNIIRNATKKELEKREFESVRQHEIFINRDLYHVERSTLDTIKKMIHSESEIISNAETKDSQILPKLKATLRLQVFPLAEKMRSELFQNYSGKSKQEIAEYTKEHISLKFQEEWSKCMKNIEQMYPTTPKQKIYQDIETDINRCVQEFLHNTSLSMAMKEIMNSNKLLTLRNFPQSVKSACDVDEALQEVGSCSGIMTKIDRLLYIAQDSINDQGEIFFERLYDSVKELLQNIDSTPGCTDKTMLLVILSCVVVQSSHDQNKQNLLNIIARNRRFLTQLSMSDILTEDDIEHEVGNVISKTTFKTSAPHTIRKLTNYFANMLGSPLDSDMDNFNNQVRYNLNEIISRLKRPRWYSDEVTSDFINMVDRLLNKLGVSGEQRHKRFNKACELYIKEAFSTERNALAENIDWTEVQTLLQIDPVDVMNQMKTFVQVLRGVLPQEVAETLTTLSQDKIRKLSNILPRQHTLHMLDSALISELPTLKSEEYDTVFSIMADARREFLVQIKSNGRYSTSLLTSMISSLYEDLNNCNELNKHEKAVSIAYLCSFAFPICVEVETAYFKENSLQNLLEKEKESLYNDFKTLCNGACLEHLAAKSFCSIILNSLIDCLRNRICSELFEKFSKEEHIFCNRPRFLQAVLENLCLEESHDNYVQFLHRNSSFIKQWILDFISKKCLNSSEHCIGIEDIALSKIERLIRETEESLDTTLCLLQIKDNMKDVSKDEKKGVSFENWVVEFNAVFEKKSSSSLNEGDVSGLKGYAHISNYSLYTAECKKILLSTFRQDLLEHAKLPDTNCIKSLKQWFECLPDKIHIKLARGLGGCGTQCPFCKTLCDDTMKEHKVHFSNLHYPTGISGIKVRSSKVLVHRTCTASVASDISYITCQCDEATCSHAARPYKEYQKDYPNWYIQPISNYEATLYWKWVLSRFNDDFARYYTSKRAEIPWGTVSKEKALLSIRESTL